VSCYSNDNYIFQVIHLLNTLYIATVQTALFSVTSLTFRYLAHVRFRHEARVIIPRAGRSCVLDTVVGALRVVRLANVPRREREGAAVTPLVAWETNNVHGMMGM